MIPKELTCLIFSKDRATQLYALLESIHFRHMGMINKLDLTVLYRTSNSEHDKQYKVVENDFINVKFVKEYDLAYQTKSIISNCKYIAFLTDDTLVYRSFDLGEIIRLLEANDDAIGFSLRLGKNVTYCYPFDKQQKLPKFEEGWGVLKFNWTKEEYDWGYPLEVSSSIYRSSDILTIMPNKFSTVNMLEAVLDSRKFNNRPFLFCYENSVAFAAPMNVVSMPETNQNRRSNNTYATPEALLSRFLNGQKLDISVLNGMTPKGCHEEIEIRWINR